MVTEEAANQYPQQMHYRIGEASAQLGLHDKNSNTLRSWVEEFKDFLGASANPEPGKPRFFTEDDLRVLRTIRDLRANHLPYNEIRARLEQGTYAVEQQTTGAEPADGQQQVERVSPKEHVQLQALLAPMVRAAEEWQTLAEQYRGRLEDREARVVALEQRVDGLQQKLEELYSGAIARAQPAPAAASPAPPAVPVRRPRRRRWLLGL